MKIITKSITILLAILITFTICQNSLQAQTTLEWIALGVLDRNSDGVSDIAFLGIGKELKGVVYDNDQDGKYNYGLVNNENIPEWFTHFWVDRNQNGKIEENELRNLARPMPFPWATFPSSYFRQTNETPDAIEHFMDSTDDFCLEEVARDIDKDGHVESYALNAHVTVCGNVSHRFLLVDTDNDGFYDEGHYVIISNNVPGGVRQQLFHFSKPLERQLPVITFPESHS